MSITFNGVRLSGNIVLPRGGSQGTKINGFSNPALINGYTGYAGMTSVAYGNGIFAAIGYDAVNTVNSLAASSTDGVTWTTPSNMNSPARTAIMSQVAYGNGIFVAVGYDWNNARAIYSTSTDGKNWSGFQNLSYFPIHGGGITNVRIMFANGNFIATMSSNSTSVANWISSDGVTWDGTHSMVNNSGFPLALAGGGGTYVVIVDNSNADQHIVLTSSDGKSWTNNGGISQPAQANLYSAAYGNGVFVAVGYGYTNHLPYYSTSTDNGATWGTLAVMNNTNVQAKMTSVTYHNGLFVAIGQNVTTGHAVYATSADGATWTTPTEFSSSYCDLQSVIYGNGVFVTVGFGGTGNQSVFAVSN